MTNIIKVSSFERKLYVETNGTLVEVKQVESVDEYPKSVTIYTKEFAKGKREGETTYAVAVEDFIPKKRVSVKESVKSMLAQGITAEEIIAKLAQL